MLFRSSRSLSWQRRIRGFFWPDIGWRRAVAYVAHRIKRLSASSHAIAAGLAAGAAVSFTPFIGFHFLLAFAVSLLTRGNLIAAALGTAVGNPWTFPAIWYATLSLGEWLLGDLAPPMPATEGFRLDLATLTDQAAALIVPMAVGSLPFAIIVWWLVYAMTRPIVQRYRDRRRTRMAAKSLGTVAAPPPGA